jgi:hypothetical protein
MGIVRIKYLGFAEKANLISQTGLYLCRQLPALLHPCGAGAPAREKAGGEDMLAGIPNYKIVTF